MASQDSVERLELDVGVDDVTAAEVVWVEKVVLVAEMTTMEVLTEAVLRVVVDSQVEVVR